MRPAHLHYMLSAPGHERLITHVFRDNDQYLDSDAVFGVRSTLMAAARKVDAIVVHSGYQFTHDLDLNCVSTIQHNDE